MGDACRVCFRRTASPRNVQKCQRAWVMTRLYLYREGRISGRRGARCDPDLPQNCQDHILRLSASDRWGTGKGSITYEAATRDTGESAFVQHSILRTRQRSRSRAATILARGACERYGVRRPGSREPQLASSHAQPQTQGARHFVSAGTRRRALRGRMQAAYGYRPPDVGGGRAHRLCRTKRIRARVPPLVWNDSTTLAGTDVWQMSSLAVQMMTCMRHA